MGSKGRILIVDDNQINLAILEEILEEEFELMAVTSGEETLAVVSEFKPSLILLDIMMPGIDGYETCRRLRKIESLCGLKIIMVSAKAMLSERMQGYEAGADDYITKPFDEQELQAKVRVYMKLHSVEEVEHLKTNILMLLGHETRTPLTHILSALELMKTDTEMEAEEINEMLEMSIQSATRLHLLIEKCLDLSTLQSGKHNFLFETADLCTVAQEALQKISQQIMERDIAIIKEFPDSAQIQMDRHTINRVVETLLDNAVRFSPQGGEVKIKVTAGGDGYRLTIIDQGDGIASDHLPHIFKAFSDPDVMHHSEGQGLSLAIAHHMVKGHGGTIEAKSIKGGCTTFTLQLPLEPR